MAIPQADFAHVPVAKAMLAFRNKKELYDLLSFQSTTAQG